MIYCYSLLQVKVATVKPFETLTVCSELQWSAVKLSDVKSLFSPVWPAMTMGCVMSVKSLSSTWWRKRTSGSKLAEDKEMMLSFSSCSSLFSGIFSSLTRSGNVAPPSRAWQSVRKRSRWLSYSQIKKSKCGSCDNWDQSGEQEAGGRTYLRVHGRHCLDLQVEQSFVALHPLDWRGLDRTFLNKQNENLCPVPPGTCRHLTVAKHWMNKPLKCAVNNWPAVVPRRLADRTDQSAGGRYSGWAATTSDGDDNERKS